MSTWTTYPEARRNGVENRAAMLLTIALLRTKFRHRMEGVRGQVDKLKEVRT